MTETSRPDEHRPWWEDDDAIPDLSDGGHFQSIHPPPKVSKVSFLGAAPEEPDEGSDNESDLGPITEEIEVIESDDTVIFYDHSFHFKAIFKKLKSAKLYKLMYAIGIACCGIGSITIINGSLPTRLWAGLILAIVIAISFVYPTMRLRFWWRWRRIVVTEQSGQAIISFEQPVSKLFAFKGSAATSFVLEGTISTNLKYETYWELFLFRKSGGGNIGTKLQDSEDYELKNLHDVYMPRALKQAINDAIRLAESR